jgi:hypothetical protein
MSFMIEEVIMKPGNLVQGNKHKSDNHGRYIMSRRVAGDWFPKFRPDIQHSKMKAARCFETSQQ